MTQSNAYSGIIRLFVLLFVDGPLRLAQQKGQEDPRA